MFQSGTGFKSIGFGNISRIGDQRICNDETAIELCSKLLWLVCY